MSLCYQMWPSGHIREVIKGIRHKSDILAQYEGSLTRKTNFFDTCIKYIWNFPEQHLNAFIRKPPESFRESTRFVTRPSLHGTHSVYKDLTCCGCLASDPHWPAFSLFLRSQMPTLPLGPSYIFRKPLVVTTMPKSWLAVWYYLLLVTRQ